MLSRRRTLTALILIAAPLLGAAARAADSPQSQSASKSARLAEVAKTDPAYKNALEAKALDELKKKIGSEVTVRGTLTQIFVPRGGNLVVLNFDKAYRTAVTAVVYKENFGTFPDLAPVEGKEVLLSGKVSEYQERPQIVLRKLEQLKLVKK